MKVSFLFGSGADTDACSLLKSGQSFSKALLDNSYKDKIKTLTNIETSHFRLLYPTSTKVFVQTIINHMDIARGVFGQNLIDDFNNYYMGENDIDFSEKIKPFCEKWADGLIHEKKSEEEKVSIWKIYAKFLFTILPIFIISLVFSFATSVLLNSFGMIVFWGILITFLYNIIFTNNILKN